MLVSRRFVICNKKGLHARPAAKLVRLAAGFPETNIVITDITRKNGAHEPLRVLATSVLGLLMLAAETGTEVTFEANGPQAEAALEAIAVLIAEKFGEDA
jgi:phosphocarrier protein HPr